MNMTLSGNQLLVVLLATLVAATAGVTIWQFSGVGLTEASTQLFTRYSARLSFLFFLPVFTAHALHVFISGRATRWLMRNRRQLGLAFAAAHGIHLVAILIHFDVAERWFTLDDVPALTIYFFIGLMAVTSNSLSVRRLKGVWGVIHKIGLYGIFVGFFTTYLGRVIGYDPERELSGDFAIYVMLLVLVTAAWLLRIAAFWRLRFS